MLAFVMKQIVRESDQDPPMCGSKINLRNIIKVLRVKRMKKKSKKCSIRTRKAVLKRDSLHA